ncbi:MAG: helix-turn-helix domain-containing protein [Vicinamibacterales bacterium]
MAAERQSADFGARLRDAREGQGVSLRVIADATKISVRALEALERNDISQLPGGIFSRAFVRAYAVQVGLDPEETIAEFLNAFPHESVVQGHPRTRHQAIETLDRPQERTIPSAVRILAALLVVAAIALYFGLAGRRSPVAPGEPVAEAASDAQPPVGSVSAVLMIELRASAGSTVTVSTDGSAFTSHVLQSGGRLQLGADRELLFSASNPSALQWTINGSEAKPLTGPVRLTPSNADAFLAK